MQVCSCKYKLIFRDILSRDLLKRPRVPVWEGNVAVYTDSPIFTTAKDKTWTKPKFWPIPMSWFCDLFDQRFWDEDVRL